MRERKHLILFHSSINISMVNILTGQPFRESGQHVNGLQRKKSTFYFWRVVYSDFLGCRWVLRMIAETRNNQF